MIKCELAPLALFRVAELAALLLEEVSFVRLRLVGKVAALTVREILGNPPRGPLLAVTFDHRMALGAGDVRMEPEQWIARLGGGVVVKGELGLVGLPSHHA